MPRCLDSGTVALFQLGWICDQGTTQGEGRGGGEVKEGGGGGTGDAGKGRRMPQGGARRLGLDVDGPEAHNYHISGRSTKINVAFSDFLRGVQRSLLFMKVRPTSPSPRPKMMIW